jgi:hypothetical protein
MGRCDAYAVPRRLPLSTHKLLNLIGPLSTAHGLRAGLARRTGAGRPAATRPRERLDISLLNFWPQLPPMPAIAVIICLGDKTRKSLAKKASTARLTPSFYQHWTASARPHLRSSLPDDVLEIARGASREEIRKKKSRTIFRSVRFQARSSPSVANNIWPVANG